MNTNFGCTDVVAFIFNNMVNVVSSFQLGYGNIDSYLRNGYSEG